MEITGNQIKAARALAGIEQTELAEAAKVSVNTVRNMEAAAERVVSVRLDTLIRVRDALLSAGIRLLDVVERDRRALQGQEFPAVPAGDLRFRPPISDTVVQISTNSIRYDFTKHNSRQNIGDWIETAAGLVGR
jgi:transcriptional regulator with XRE-family HTH domain